MQTIDHRRFQKKAPRRQLPLMRIGRIAGAVILVLIACNILMGMLYHDKALPGYRLGAKNVSGMRYSEIAKLKQPEVMRATIDLTLKSGKNTAQKTVKVSDFGVTVDMSASVQHLKQSRTWLPMLSLLGQPQVALVTSVDAPTFESAVTALAPEFEKASTDKHVAYTGSAFEVQTGQDGYKIDRATLKAKLATALTDGQARLAVPVVVLPAGTSTNDLSGEVVRLTKLISPAVSFATTTSPKSVPTNAEKATWLVPQGQTMVLSDEAIGHYLDRQAEQQGIPLSNRADLIVATKYALAKSQPYNFRMISAASSHKHTYCTAVKGIGTAGLDDLIGKLAATYADARGWNDGGTIAFEHVDNGCSYTVWLSAPQYMTTFGAICDDYYNCQVGSNVVVNNDRWDKATEPWNQTGRTIEEYRSLIINHETGHRLGFRDNNVPCTQPGQLAMVMMQQSISLMGCTFNPWPLQAELDAL